MSRIGATKQRTTGVKARKILVSGDERRNAGAQPLEVPWRLLLSRTVWPLARLRLSARTLVRSHHAACDLMSQTRSVLGTPGQL